MAQYQLLGYLFLLAILLAQAAGEAPRRLRLSRQRQLFARQEVAPTPYPSADELKPEEPALIYGPPPSTDVNELPAAEEPPANSFQPDDATEPTEAEAEELDNEENSLEETTPATSARLRSSRQRLAKLQLAKAQPKRQLKQRQRIARLEQLPAPVAAPAGALPAPQFYFLAGQQPYVVAFGGPAAQQLAW